MRKGDFEHIVDDVSDGEGDEAAGAQARAEMELQEDRARDRAIITAVTEGHDAMCKLTRKGKGAFSFERLVGGDSKRGGGAEGGAEGGAAVEEEEDLEELMQRGMQGRLEMERSSKARRGYHGSDSDSDSAADSDTDENLLEQLGESLFSLTHVVSYPHLILCLPSAAADTSDMTEEQKREEQEKHQRIQEQKRMDALMAKQRIQSYKMARERARQERLQKQLQLQQQQSGGVSGSGASAFPGSLSLMRQESTGASQYSRPAVSRTLTLEPLHDEYSRIFMNSVCDQGGASMGGTYPMMASSTSSSNLMPPTSGASSTGITPRSSATDYKLVDVKIYSYYCL